MRRTSLINRLSQPSTKQFSLRGRDAPVVCFRLGRVAAELVVGSGPQLSLLSLTGLAPSPTLVSEDSGKCILSFPAMSKSVEESLVEAGEVPDVEGRVRF